MTDKAPHSEVAHRLVRAQQRYTTGRRRLVELLHGAGRPLEIFEIADASAELPVSSIYRNLVVLEQAGAVTRYPGAGGSARYELSEELVGHHHHLVCANCGRMEDYDAPPEVEDHLRSVVEAVAAGNGFQAASHRLELRGLCARCA